MRAHGITLESDAEELGLEAVFHTIEFLLHDLVERGSKDLTIFLPLYRHVLRTVVYPDIHDTGVALSLTHGIGNVTATLGMLNPEVADALVRVRQREVATLRVRERS